jgi:hypothetical protein
MQRGSFDDQGLFPRKRQPANFAELSDGKTVLIL